MSLMASVSWSNNNGLNVFIGAGMDGAGMDGGITM